MGARGVVPEAIALAACLAVSCKCGSKGSSSGEAPAAEPAAAHDAAPPDAGPARAAIEQVDMIAGGRLLLWRSSRTDQADAGARPRAALLVRDDGAAAAPGDEAWTIAHVMERAAGAAGDRLNGPPEVRMGERRFGAGTIQTVRAAGGGLSDQDRVKATYEVTGNVYQARFESRRGDHASQRSESGLWSGDLLLATTSSAAGAAVPQAHGLTVGVRQAPCPVDQVDGEWRAHNLVDGVPPGTWKLERARFTATVYWGDRREEIRGVYRVVPPCQVVLTQEGRPAGERFEAQLRPDAGIGLVFLRRGEAVEAVRLWSRADPAAPALPAGRWRLFAAGPVRSGPVTIAADGTISGHVQALGVAAGNQLEGRLTPGNGGLQGTLEWKPERPRSADAGAP